MPYTYDYPMLGVAVDVAVFANGSTPSVLLIKRGHEPYEGQWALPGGFVEITETIATGAARELQEETGLENIALNFFGYFDAIHRDPRKRTVAFAFWGEIDAPIKAAAADDAAEADWFALDNLPSLAFDHAEIIARAVSAWNAARA